MASRLRFTERSEALTVIKRALACILFLIAPPLARTAAACMCMSSPPCAAAWRADAVFVGVVVSVQLEGLALQYPVYSIAVSRVLLGNPGPTVAMTPLMVPSPEEIAAAQARGRVSSWGRSSCEYDFVAGNEYVVYARRTADGRWTTSLCAGTKPMEKAAEDLEYFASIPTLAPLGRVYGKVERMLADPADAAKWRTVPAAGVPVMLTSAAAQLTVATDAEGKIDVTVPPGDYEIAPSVPRSTRVYGAPYNASLIARGCAPVDFQLISNGQISGRVVLADGTPVRGLSVEAIPVEFTPGEKDMSSTRVPSGTTDDKGRFVISPILPGRYNLAANARFGPRERAPFAPTYYPASASPADAEPIALSDGEAKDGFTIVVKRLRALMVYGSVIDRDERPQPGVRVSAEAAGYPGSITTAPSTDAGGEFHIRLLEGLTYVIRAYGPGQVRGQTTVTVTLDMEPLRVTIRP